MMARLPLYAESLETDRESASVPEWLEAALETEVDRRSSAYVRWVQRTLNKILGTRLAVDGVLGASTRSATRSFQRSRGLKADGIVGAQTERALIDSGAGSPPAPAAPPGPIPSLPTRPSPASARACPEPARRGEDRCLHPGTKTCPAIPNLVCLKAVDDIPFEYPEGFGRDASTGLMEVTRRQSTRTQRFIPPVREALSRFIANMRRVGMPIEAILTAGSLYCRCISNSDNLSKHSFGDAIDVVGVRWAAVGGPASQLRETIVHNYRDPQQRALLRRINACLRLPFKTVIDYHRADHRDHFHCDMNQGRERPARGATTLVFVQEALSLVLGRPIASTGRLDTATQQGLREFAGGADVVADGRQLQEALDRLFTRVATGR
jgi:Putative peptidoglycan binding domain/Extensin-like protein C-terminus